VASDTKEAKVNARHLSDIQDRRTGAALLLEGHDRSNVSTDLIRSGFFLAAAIEEAGQLLLGESSLPGEFALSCPRL
jgi:hypothetical protein